MTFQIVLRDGGIWAERTFESYQKQPLTLEAARDVVLSSHRIVGMFLRCHDKSFRWIDEPFEGQYPERPETVRPSLGEPLPLCCVPRARFLQSSQSFEFIPGYTIEFSFSSESRYRRGVEWKRTLRLDSRQNTPLNLTGGENLLWQASSLVMTALDSRKKAFDQEHQACEGLDGNVNCQHFEQNAVEIDLRITNNLGPAYDHLQRSIKTKLGLFRHPDGIDCHNFVCDLQTKLEEVRDEADVRVARMTDFDFRVIALRGPGWEVDNTPLVFRLDPRTTHCRRAIQGMLDRVQSGIADVLRGNNMAIHTSAYKRGHLVLDKAMIAHEEEAGKAAEKFASMDEQQVTFIARLRERIQRDLDMICKDTCSLDDPVETQEVHAEAGPTLDEESTEEFDVSTAAAEASQSGTEDPLPSEEDLGDLDMMHPTPEPARVKFEEDRREESNTEESQHSAGPAVEDNGDSSRPSTPGLSSGAETSPRNSILITPTHHRTLSGAKNLITRIFEAEGEVRAADSVDPTEELDAGPIADGTVGLPGKPIDSYPRSPDSSPLLQKAMRMSAAVTLRDEEGAAGPTGGAEDKGNDEPEDAVPTDACGANDEVSHPELTVGHEKQPELPSDRSEVECGAEPRDRGDSGLALGQVQPSQDGSLSDPGHGLGPTSITTPLLDGPEISDMSVVDIEDELPMVAAAAAGIGFVSQELIGEPASDYNSQPRSRPSTPCRPSQEMIGSSSVPVTPRCVDGFAFGAAGEVNLAETPSSPGSLPVPTESVEFLPLPLMLSTRSSVGSTDDAEPRVLARARPRLEHRRQMSSPTAGYFGLRRSPLVTPGIRTSLAGSTCFQSSPIAAGRHDASDDGELSDPDQPDDKTIAGPSQRPQRPSIWSSPPYRKRAQTAGPQLVEVPCRAPRSLKRPQTAYEEKIAGGEQERGLPKAMMILAGVTIVSQMLNKSS